jgi:NAD(P)-dependent dehydrogenase (short-subunit alcohol dehydrogenase family)
MYNPFSLEKKTILIIGAASGIGQATAIECAKMDATVIIIDRNQESLNETFLNMKSGNHKQLLADLTEIDALEKIIGINEIYDGAVLSAGIGMHWPFLYSDREKFNDVFEINFYAQIELIRLLVKKKKINKGGSIVFVSSIDGIYKFSHGHSCYSASKAALNAMMKIMAVEFAPKIRVNSVNPGMVDTKLIRVDTATEEQFIKNAERYPLKRLGKPSDIAFSIIYLLSDASSWITGSTLIIDGGISI